MVAISFTNSPKEIEVATIRICSRNSSPPNSSQEFKTHLVSYIVTMHPSVYSSPPNSRQEFTHRVST